jgi:type I restriction enzyme R subunit
MTPEQQARQNIDAQLLASGWIVQDCAKMDLSVGRGIAIREVPLKTGPCDYLLLVDRRPVTESMLKELEKKLRENHAAWTEDRLWDAFAITAPGKVKGRSRARRFADIVALVRFTLQQQPVLEPFAESVHKRFNEWLMDKAKGGTTLTPDQLAWLNLIRDHIATSLSIEADDFDYAPFSQRGGLGKAHQLFGDDLSKLLEELNERLAA